MTEIKNVVERCKTFAQSVHEWNKIIYANGNEDCINAERLYKEFGLCSWPLFEGCCAYNVPGVWAEEVSAFIKQVQSELGHRITFVQIKEKFCRLTVYYDYADQEADERIKVLLNECIDKLIVKGVHPPKEEC